MKKGKKTISLPLNIKISMGIRYMMKQVDKSQINRSLFKIELQNTLKSLSQQKWSKGKNFNWEKLHSFEGGKFCAEIKEKTFN